MLSAVRHRGSVLGDSVHDRKEVSASEKTPILGRYREDIAEIGHHIRSDVAMKETRPNLAKRVGDSTLREDERVSPPRALESRQRFLLQHHYKVGKKVISVPFIRRR